MSLEATTNRIKLSIPTILFNVNSTLGPLMEISFIIWQDVRAKLLSFLFSYSYLLNQILKGCGSKFQPSNGKHKGFAFKEWNQIKDSECISEYLALKLGENQIDKLRLYHQGQGHKTFPIFIGENKCNKKTDRESSCELRSGTKYALMVRLCTKNTFADSSIIHFQTRREFFKIILFAVIAMICIAVIAAVYVHNRRSKKLPICGWYEFNICEYQRLDLNFFQEFADIEWRRCMF